MVDIVIVVQALIVNNAKSVKRKQYHFLNKRQFV